MAVFTHSRVIAVLLLLGVVILIGYEIQDTSGLFETDESRQAADAVVSPDREIIARFLVAGALLEISNTSLSNENLNWKFRGSVKNNSAYTITEITFHITISDCAISPCGLIGGSDAKTQLLLVPPGQTRSFEGLTIFDNLLQTSMHQWTFEIIGTHGKNP
jgi:hypothetical protein